MPNDSEVWIAGSWSGVLGILVTDAPLSRPSGQHYKAVRNAASGNSFAGLYKGLWLEGSTKALRVN